jgi:biopolymer transport protein ExbB
VNKRTTITLLLAIALGIGFAAPVFSQQEPTAEAAAETAKVRARAELDRIEAESALAAEEGRTLADWYGMGGWIMHGLVFCSVLVMTLVLERMWALRRNAVIPRKFMKAVMQHWERREIPQVVALCAASDVSIARVMRSGLIHFEEGLSRVEDAIGVSGDHEATLLRRNLPVLAALGNIATMMGLLGTVLGMIESFDLIAKTGTGDARVVAGGIFTALVTTAAGLMVGITAIAAHSYLRRKVEVLEIDLEETSFRLLESLAVERSASPGPAAANAGGLTPQEA